MSQGKSIGTVVAVATSMQFSMLSKLCSTSHRFTASTTIMRRFFVLDNFSLVLQKVGMASVASDGCSCSCMSPFAIAIRTQNTVLEWTILNFDDALDRWDRLSRFGWVLRFLSWVPFGDQHVHSWITMGNLNTELDLFFLLVFFSFSLHRSCFFFVFTFSFKIEWIVWPTKRLLSSTLNVFGWLNESQLEVVVKRYQFKWPSEQQTTTEHNKKHNTTQQLFLFFSTDDSLVPDLVCIFSQCVPGLLKKSFVQIISSILYTNRGSTYHHFGFLMLFPLFLSLSLSLYLSSDFILFVRFG